jgi:hypothetical protein
VRQHGIGGRRSRRGQAKQDDRRDDGSFDHEGFRRRRASERRVVWSASGA